LRVKFAEETDKAESFAGLFFYVRKDFGVFLFHPENHKNRHVNNGKLSESLPRKKGLPFKKVVFENWWV